MSSRLIILPSIPPNIFYPYNFDTKGKLIKDEVELIITLNVYDEILNYNRHEPTNQYLMKLNDKIRTVSGAYTYQKGDEILTVGLKGRTQKSGEDKQISGFNDLVIYHVKVEVE